MWLLAGIAVLLTGVAIADLTDENAYYVAETNEEQSMDVIEKSRYERPEIDGALEGTRPSESEEEQPRPDNNGPLRDPSLQKEDTKRSMVKTNVHDRSSTHLQPSLSTLLYWPEREDQLVAMEQRSNPVIQERRNPSFSPWGGKRDSQHYRTITKIRRPVRVPFNSWGGKRNGERIQRTFADLKRGKFLNWGGKKTPPFNSWGGKRGAAGIDFHLVPMNHRQEHRQGLRQRDQLDLSDVRNDFDSNSAAAEESYSEKMMSNETWEKRGSLKPLVAGGEMTTSGSTSGNSFPRVPFEPWGGKKRGEMRFRNDGQPSAGVSLIFRKIGRLIPWTA